MNERPPPPPRKKDRTASYRELEAASPSFLLKRAILDDVLARHLARPAESAWDAGCGAGTLSPLIATRTRGELLLTDFEPGGVAMAVERVAGTRPGLRVRGETLDLQRAAAPPGAFELVVCWAVLEHLADDGHGFALLARGLRPGGTLVVNVPLHPRLTNALDRLEDHHRRYALATLRGFAAAHGLAVRELRPFGFPGLLATKLLWAPFAAHESRVAVARGVGPAARLLARMDWACYRAGVPLGVEGLLVAGRPASSSGGTGSIPPP